MILKYIRGRLNKTPFSKLDYLTVEANNYWKLIDFELLGAKKIQTVIWTKFNIRVYKIVMLYILLTKKNHRIFE